MFLKRIQVPDFRVLKDVDISFEPEFSPRVFPLGSLNGGGKSTLLQLIFILLSCSSDPEKHIFIQNLLEGFELEPGETQKTIATICLFDEGSNQDIELRFFCHQDEIALEDNNTHDDDNKQLLNTKPKFSKLGLEQEIKEEILELKKEIASNRLKANKLKAIQNTEDFDKKRKAIKQEIDNIKYGSVGRFLRDLFKLDGRTIGTIDINEITFELETLINEFEKGNVEIRNKINQKDIEVLEVRNNSIKIENYLRTNKLIHVCNYTSVNYL